MDEFQLFEDELRSGDVLGVLLTKQGLAYPEIHKIVENSKGILQHQWYARR